MRFTWRCARWPRSIPVLVAHNAALVLLAVCVGWHASSARNLQLAVRLDNAAHDTAGNIRRQALHILSGNLRVVAALLAGTCTLGAALLAGTCTLGLFTLLELLWNAVGLGIGLSALARGTPDAIPLVIRYVPLEFSAFVLAASAAEHLSFMVLRCLAAGEAPQFISVTAALAAALGMLVAAAIIEANVTQFVAALTG